MNQALHREGSQTILLESHNFLLCCGHGHLRGRALTGHAEGSQVQGFRPDKILAAHPGEKYQLQWTNVAVQGNVTRLQTRPDSPEGAEEPVPRKGAHGIAFHPIGIQLLDSRDKIHNEDLVGSKKH